MSQALRDRLLAIASQLSEVLAEEASTPATLAAQLQDVFAGVLGSEGVEFALRDDHNGRSAHAHRVPLRYAGSDVGALLIHTGESLSDDDRLIVDSCAPYIAFALRRLLQVNGENGSRGDHTSLVRLTSKDLFNDRLQHALARANRHFESVGLICVDVAVPDARDEKTGEAYDAVLRTLARRMIRAVRVTDSVGRLGHDEFAVLLEDVEDDVAVEHIVEKIRTTVESPVKWNRKTLRVQATIGWSVAPRDGYDHAALMERARLTQRSGA